MDLDALAAELGRDEGERLKPYRDSTGHLTIGVGRNLDDVGISAAESRFLLQNDIVRTLAELDRCIPWWRELDEVRQRVIANMAFNIGVDGDPGDPDDALTGFHRTLAAVRTGNFVAAANGMMRSKWAQQVGPRAARLARAMVSGTLET